MLLPALARARGEARARSNVIGDSQLNMISIAFDAYQADHKGNLPATLADLFPQYIGGNGQALISPSDPAPMKIKNGMVSSYRFIGNVSLHNAPPELFVAYDHTPFSGARNVLHADGHVQRYTEQEFRKQLAKQYEQFKPIMAAPDFPGDRDRVKAFFEDKDFEEK